jgi:hypothetical protein
MSTDKCEGGSLREEVVRARLQDSVVASASMRDMRTDLQERSRPAEASHVQHESLTVLKRRASNTNL